MSKQPTLFKVGNSEWTIQETRKDVFELRTSDTKKKISDLTGKQLAAALAVITELARYLQEKR